jgi:hypothetical protein
MTAKTGLLKTLPPIANDTDPIDWLVDPKTFVLTVATTIPLKTYTLTAPHIVPADADKGVTPNQDFGIGPTSTTSDDLASSIVITATTNETSVFDAFMNRAATPKAVWEKRDLDGNGVPQNVDPVNGTTISNVLTGFDLVPTVPPPKHSLPIDLINLQFTTDLQMQTLAWSVPAVQTSDPFTPAQTVVSTIGGDRAKGNRSALIDSINRSGFAVRGDIDVATLADPAATYLLASPALRYLGEAR